MKVLHLISSGGFYGAESLLVNLIKAQRCAGLDASLLAFDNRRNTHIEVVERCRRESLPAQILPCSGRLDRDAIRAIAKLVHESGVTLLHSHGYKSNFYANAASARTGVPFVATCHLWTGSSLTVRIYELLDAYVLRKADHVVAVSNQILEALRESGLPASKTSLIHNGVGAGPRDNVAPSLRAELGIGDAPLIGTLARLEEQKGLRYFIEAAERVLVDIPEASFVIAGDGSLRQHLTEMIARKGLQGRVLLLGQRDDVQNIYSSLDIFVLASLSEGLPMVLLEALSTALPVVATSVGAASHVVRSGYSGLLVEPGNAIQMADAILACLRERDDARSLGINGRMTVQAHFSADSMARKYQAVYDHLIQARSANRATSLAES